MNIKKIEKICREKRQIYVVTGSGGEQWIGTDEGLYLMGDLGGITARQLFKVFELPKEEEELYALTDGEAASAPEDYNDADTELDMSDMSVELRGLSLIPFFAYGVAYWVRSDRLSPLGDEKNLSYHLRKEGEKCSIIVKKGMLVTAKIAPTSSMAEVLYESLRLAFFGMRGQWKYDNEEQKYD